MRFIARLATSDELHINIEADRMEESEATITAYRKDKLIAIIDKGALITAYLTGGGE